MENTKQSYKIDLAARLDEILGPEIGITKRARFLEDNASMAKNTAWRWVRGEMVLLDLGLLPRVCDLLECTPNDILKLETVELAEKAAA